jgi:hypothetical protein
MRIPLLIVISSLLASACAPAVVSAPVSRTPIYPGFDAWRYPGDDLMVEWRRSSPYRWVGYYLPSPCHRAETFAGRRQFLTQTGWGVAVIYVGQQLFEDQTPAEITESTVCSSALLTAERGVADGDDAVARTRAEGFPPGTVIFLDIERVGRIPPELITYYHAWLRTILADGTYRPGTYAHSSNASGLYTVAQRVLQEEGEHSFLDRWRDRLHTRFVSRRRRISIHAHLAGSSRCLPQLGRPHSRHRRERGPQSVSVGPGEPLIARSATACNRP